ncbi:MAG TPA: DEAD/DEAH box helicase [Verrucomicrobiae bacterium]|nr:DEAD/DEAH box helicase [Verrucomicrobiae bacterium]
MSWVTESLPGELLDQAHTEASRRLLGVALHIETEPADNGKLSFAANSLELAAIDFLEDEGRLVEMRQVCAEAFQLLRVLPRPDNPIEAAKLCLRIGCLAVLGERGADAARVLTEAPWPPLPINSQSWGERVLATILDVWLRLVRKKGWEDLDEVQRLVVSLREQQQNFEGTYLAGQEETSRSSAWQLVAFYHLAKAADILATYTVQGDVGGRFDIVQQLEAQFDRALTACSRAEFIELHTLTRLLTRTARQLIENSIWTVTRAVNSRVSRFVQELVGEKGRPIFEMLPPQRRALRENGLLGSGHRAVVVNLPTSSGKTFIAEFRILQALNQFEREKGWTAYLAPTRALVNQICTRLRRDFAPLDIHVERVSPALEVDGLEAGLLIDKNENTRFHVLVTTPEKLDLLLRTGWEEKIGRPLTLVVVDEAHNLAQKERGIKLELLLATINRECRYAQFLLLTPFIRNADEIAKWLAPESNMDVEIGLDWQPNDLSVVLSKPVQSGDNNELLIALETLHTNKTTLTVPEQLRLAGSNPLGITWKKATKGASDLAAATAEILKERGPVIVLAARPAWVWSLAAKFKTEKNRIAAPEPNVQLVQRYLSQEFGEDFELCELLNYGVGIHHSGLSEEAKALMEWLIENEQIQVLVATTTIAQGVNFPVSAVVLAHNTYYDKSAGTVEMPPEDFWNIAGRAGRVHQESLGFVALAAINDTKALEVKSFVNRQVLSLNSTLIAMVQKAMLTGEGLSLHQLFYQPEWSTFLQYLAHTYRQIGDPERFSNEIEQVLRGTLGFQSLRRTNMDWAAKLVTGVQAYADRIAGKPLQLVDSTGFSWESVSITLSNLAEERITENVWDANLFRAGNADLPKMMGILLAVPEIRENLQAATGGRTPNGDLLARMISDWVNGASLPDMASKYFTVTRSGKTVDKTTALTECCRNLFGRLTQTASWGIAALQTMTFRDRFDRLSEDQQQTLRNLPARVFYGVNTDEAIALRLLGVPRGAAQPLARSLGAAIKTTPVSDLRSQLRASNTEVWARAIGATGGDYFQVWRILEGLG